jgi:hypothetical protein
MSRHVDIESPERLTRLYGDSRKPEKDPDTPGGRLVVQHLDEQNAMNERHRRESSLMSHKHEMETNRHLASSRAMPEGLKRGQETERQNMKAKHVREQSAMAERHRHERSQLRQSGKRGVVSAR